MSASSASGAHADGNGLARGTLLAYSLPGLVTAVPTIPVFTLLPAFYATQVGLGLALTGLLLFVSRGLDVITDPLIGRLADRAGGRGLRRLILLGALLAAPALMLLLAPPAGAGATWLLLTSTALYLGWTLIQVPYLTWGARLSHDYHERTRVTAGRELAAIIGILLSGALPLLLGLGGLGEADRLWMMGLVAVLLGIPCFTLLLRAVPAPAPFRPAAHDWRGITGNGLFMRLLFAWFINGLANGIPAVLFPLFCLYVLGVSDETRNLLLAVYFTSAVAGIPFWLWYSRKVGKHRSWCRAMLLTCPAFMVAAALGPGDTLVFAAVCVLTGLCLGADLALPPAIQADVADWDRLRFRRNRTAGLFSLWNMGSKLALAAAAGLALPLSGLLDLDTATRTTTDARLLALIYALLPCVIKVVAILLVRDLPLTAQRQAAIATRLQRRDRTVTG